MMTDTHADELAGKALLATTDQLVSITDEARRYSWSARLGQDEIRDSIDQRNLHLIVPFLVNGVEGDMPPSCRCYLWYKQAAANARSCVVIDVSDQQLRTLQRPTVKQFDRLVMMLVEQLPVGFLELK